jgi:undecaprenyl-diphosphatase
LAHPRRSGGVAGGLLLVAFLLAVIVGNDPSPFGVDIAWAKRATAIRGDGLTFVANVFGALGRFPLSWLIVTVAGSILWRQRRHRAVAVLVIGEVASWATNSLIKAAVDRPRPPGAIVEAFRSSFPSGHAAFAAVTAVLLVGLLVPTGRRVGPAFLAAALALVMGLSRIYLGVHWLSDMIAGLCVGAGIGLLTLAFAGSAADRQDVASPDPASSAS